MLQAQRLSTGGEGNLPVNPFPPDSDKDQQVEEQTRSFHLARRTLARLLSERVMHFSIRKTAAVISIGSLIFYCSCEKHRVGEDPDVQKERVDEAKGGEDENASAPGKADVPEPAKASPTPADFFPKTTPSP
jgi:hypothetical protein